MRLIDGDKLKRGIKNHCVMPIWCHELVKAEIDEMPTIHAEPVTAEWIFDEYGNPHCSKCEHIQDVPTRYCSECGAKMNGGDQK